MTKQNYQRPYTTRELANLYNVNERTFKRWIEPFADEIGERIGNFFSIRQVAIIFEKLGCPIEKD